MPKLFTEAAKNDDLLNQRYGNATDDPAKHSPLSDFHTNIRISAKLSINMRPHVVVSLLTNGTYENIYQQAKKISSLSNRTVDEELRRLLGKYYTKRIALDTALEIPETTYYAALNIGGLGAPRYGSFCLILNGLAVDKQDTVYIAKDSLQNYVDGDGYVDVEKIISDACSSRALPELCCIKHAHDPLLSDPLAWPRMACNDNVYVEAIIDQELTSALISEIRIARNEYNDLMELALGGTYGTARGNADRALAQDFLEILSAAKNAGIPINALEVDQ